MPLPRRAAAPLLALLLAAAPAAAQLGMDVDARRLALGTDTLDVYVVTGADTVRTGWIADELSVVDGPGGPLLRRVYVTRDERLGAGTDTIVDRVPGLAPVRHAGRSGMEERLEFTADRVTGWMRMSEGDSVAVDKPLSPPFYNSASFDLVLRAADLAEGWSGEVFAYMAPFQQVVPLRASVQGTEEVGGASCWRVEVNALGMPVTYWIDRASRRLCRQRMRPDEATQVLFVPRRAVR